MYYMYVHICISIHFCICLYIPATSTCEYIYIYIYKYTYAYTFAFTYPYILVHTYIEWFSQCKQDIGNKTRTSDRLSAMRLHRSMRWLSRRGTVHATSRDAND